MSWIIRAEPFAYNELQLLPDQFWSLTPHEYNLLREAYYRRRRQRLEREAYWICQLVNHFPMRGRNAPTLRPEKMIGYSDEQLADIKREQRRREMEQKKGR